MLSTPFRTTSTPCVTPSKITTSLPTSLTKTIRALLLMPSLKQKTGLMLMMKLQEKTLMSNLKICSVSATQLLPPFTKHRVDREQTTMTKSLKIYERAKK